VREFLQRLRNPRKGRKGGRARKEHPEGTVNPLCVADRAKNTKKERFSRHWRASRRKCSRTKDHGKREERGGGARRFLKGVIRSAVKGEVQAARPLKFFG